MSTNKVYPSYNKLKAENYNITKFLLPPYTHYKYVTTKEKFEALSRALRVHLVKDTTISSSKSPKSHVKIITNMQYDNVFEPLIAAVLSVSPQRGLVPKAQYLVIPFRICEGWPIPDFHLRALAIRSELVLMQYKTGHINNLIGKYIMELSKLKHLQRYMTSFELDFRRFERQSQSDQLSNIFTPSMEVILETLETTDIEMNPPHSMIEPIVNRKFRNMFHHQNVPNQHQRTKKNAIQKYQHINTRQQYQHRNTGQHHQHIILVNNVKTDPSKYPGHLRSHTWSKTVLDVDLTAKVWENC